MSRPSSSTSLSSSSSSAARPHVARPPFASSSVPHAAAPASAPRAAASSAAASSAASASLAPRLPTGGGVLRTRFVAPPFSRLDAAQGPWQQRKKEWTALIGDSGAGRDNTLLSKGRTDGLGVLQKADGSIQGAHSPLLPLLLPCSLAKLSPHSVPHSTILRHLDLRPGAHGAHVQVVLPACEAAPIAARDRHRPVCWWLLPWPRRCCPYA